MSLPSLRIAQLCLLLSFSVSASILHSGEKGRDGLQARKKLAYLLLDFSSSEKVSLCNPVCSETLCVDQAILELTEICLPLIPKCRD